MSTRMMGHDELSTSDDTEDDRVPGRGRLGCCSLATRHSSFTICRLPMNESHRKFTVMPMRYSHLIRIEDEHDISSEDEGSQIVSAQRIRSPMFNSSLVWEEMLSSIYLDAMNDHRGNHKLLQPLRRHCRSAATQLQLPQVGLRAHTRSPSHRHIDPRMVSTGGDGGHSSARSPRGGEVSSPVIPAKRLPAGVSKIQGKCSSYDGDEDELPAKRPPKRGKTSSQSTENKIPCICFMTGKPEYRKCTKRHKYLSHLARHLHSHDVYICQMCFSKFDQHGKEENLRKKQAHHCVKLCNDGNCKRHCTETNKALSTSDTCKHLVSWQDRWLELFQASFPGFIAPPLGSMDGDNSGTPELRSRQNSASTQMSIPDKDQAVEPIGTAWSSTVNMAVRQNTNQSRQLEPTREDHKDMTQANWRNQHLSHERREALAEHVNTSTSCLPGQSVAVTEHTLLDTDGVSTMNPPFDDDNVVIVAVEQDMTPEPNTKTTNLGSKKAPNETHADVKSLTDRVHTLESALDRSLCREKGLLLELTELKREFKHLKVTNGGH